MFSERASVSVSNIYENTENVPRQRVSIQLLYMYTSIYISTSCNGLSYTGTSSQGSSGRRVSLADDDVSAVVSKALHLVQSNNKPILTQPNGFSRNLKADAIMGAFLLDGELVFAVRFKGRKLPQFIQAQEVHVRAPILYIQYFIANMNYD